MLEAVGLCHFFGTIVVLSTANIARLLCLLAAVTIQVLVFLKLKEPLIRCISAENRVGPAARNRVRLVARFYLASCRLQIETLLARPRYLFISIVGIGRQLIGRMNLSWQSLEGNLAGRLVGRPGVEV